MKKNLLVILFVIFNSCLTNAQTSQFVKSYDVETKSDFTQSSDMILTFDSCYAIALTSYDSSLMTNTLELLKISSNGSVIWRQTFQSPAYCYNTQLIQMPDSGYLITSSYQYSFDTTVKVILIKTGSTGIQQWVKLLGDNHLSQVARGVRVKGNNIFVVSSGVRKLGGGTYDHNYFITKTDLLGNIIWYKYYNWEGAPYPKIFLVTDDYKIYIAGELTNGNAQMAMSKIDSSGNIIWSKIYSPFGAVDPLDMLIDNSNIILTGRTGAYGFGQLDIFLMKLDTSGNFIWAKAFGTPNWDEGYNVFKTQNGFMICAEPESFGNKSRAALMQTDTSGNLQWMKIYGDSTGSFPNGAVQLNNGFAIYGIKGNFNSYAPIYLMKTNLNGITSCKWTSVTLPDSSFTLTTSDTGFVGTVQGEMNFNLVEQLNPLNVSDDCGHASIDFIPAEIKTVSINPNPFHNEFSLVIQKQNTKQVSILIQNVLGQTVFSEHDFNSVVTKTIDLSDLANGIYFLEINIDGERTVKKIIKQ